MFLLSCGLFFFLGVHSLRMLAPNWRMKLMWPPGRICRDLAGVNVRILRSPSSSKHRL